MVFDFMISLLSPKYFQNYSALFFTINYFYDESILKTD